MAILANIRIGGGDKSILFYIETYVLVYTGTSRYIWVGISTQIFTLLALSLVKRAVYPLPLVFFSFVLKPSILGQLILMGPQNLRVPRPPCVGRVSFDRPYAPHPYVRLRCSLPEEGFIARPSEDEDKQR